MLTAREWLLLPEDEQKERKTELSPQELRKLRIELSMIHFSEEEKENMSEEKKYKFTHPRELSERERKEFDKSADEVLHLFGILKPEEHIINGKSVRTEGNGEKTSQNASTEARTSS